ncbi:helix-turn-helix transcriptional regulator [Streptomyces sp. NPDC093982]|uniref:helix-turn-helix domain-containing protein n=1 Tax=Streptomyces sp. NPDC093982 TaxID=3155077 RepID=UPI00341C17D1
MATPMPIPGDAPEAVRALAVQLRNAKEKAGLSVAKLAKEAHFSTATISLAASGKKVPTLPVTLAYVAACKDDKGEEYWSVLWAAADAAEKGQDLTGDEPDNSAAPSSSGNARSASRGRRARPRRQSVDELVEEALTRLRQDGANTVLDRTRSRLELCISAEQFCDVLRGARGDRSLGEIKETARIQGFNIRKFDISTMIREDNNNIPDPDTLHAYLMGCEVEPGIVQLWHNTATRLRIMKAWQPELGAEGGTLLHRLLRRLRRTTGGLRFDVLLTLICTLILTAAQVFYLIR